MSTGKCKRPERIRRSIGFIVVYGNVPTRRATTVSTSMTLKYRAYRSFHRRFYKRVSRNRSIKTGKKRKKKEKTHRCLSVRDIAQCRPESGLDKCVLPFIFCPNECRTTRFGTYIVTFVLVSRNVPRVVSRRALHRTLSIRSPRISLKPSLVYPSRSLQIKKNLLSLSRRARRLTKSKHRENIYRNSQTRRFASATREY